MFSLDRFSLSRFSLGAEESVIKLEVSFSDEMKSVSGVAVQVPASAFIVDAIHGGAKGAIAVHSAFSSEADMQAKVGMKVNIMMPFYFEESARGVTSGSRNKSISCLFVDAIDSASGALKVMHFGSKMDDRVRAAAFASKNIMHSMFASEVATTSVRKQSAERTTVTITIPPGGELRIDSETYRVMLDGENALHAQEGDWIKLSREVLYLDIETASGGPLEGSITYKERYL